MRLQVGSSTHILSMNIGSVPIPESVLHCLSCFRSLYSLNIYGISITPPSTDVSCAVPPRPFLEAGKYAAAYLRMCLTCGALDKDVLELQKCPYCGAPPQQSETFSGHTRASCPRKPTTDLFLVLNRVSSGAMFRALTVWVDPSMDASRSGRTYHTHREGLLDLLFGAEMVQALERIPALEKFDVSLRDIDPQYNGTWWKEHVIHRNPRLRTAITVWIELKDPKWEIETPFPSPPGQLELPGGEDDFGELAKRNWYGLWHPEPTEPTTSI